MFQICDEQTSLPSYYYSITFSSSPHQSNYSIEVNKGKVCLLLSLKIQAFHSFTFFSLHNGFFIYSMHAATRLYYY